MKGVERQKLFSTRLENLPEFIKPSDKDLYIQGDISTAADTTITKKLYLLGTWMAYVLEILSDIEADILYMKQSLKTLEAQAYTGTPGTAAVRQANVDCDLFVIESRATLSKKEGLQIKVKNILLAYDKLYAAYSRELSRRSLKI